MDAFAGAIGVSDSEGKSTPVYSVCTPQKKDDVDPHYYAYFLRNLALTGFIESLTKGIRERSTDFRYNDFGKLLLAHPPYEEQTAIARFLDEKTSKIDEAISIKQKQIELLKERRQILIHKAVTRGLNPDITLKPSGVDWIGEIPEHWGVMKIKFVTMKIGSGVTPSGGATTYLNDGVPLLRSQNIHFGRIDLSDVAFISQRVHNSMSNSKVNKGDVLLNITGGSIGRCHYVETDIDLNVNQHVCIVRPNSKVLPVFLNAVFASEVGQGQIWFFQQGGGREGLNFQAIKNFYIPLPPTNEQESISYKIRQISSNFDKSIRIQEQEIRALKEYKSSLINKAVTGKIKVS